MTKSLRYSIALLLLSSLLQGTAGYAQTLPLPAHIVVLFEENYAYSDIIGSSYAPNINTLAHLPNAALFSGFCATAHPSQPNYLQFFSGSDQGLITDDYPTDDGLTIPFTTPNLAAELIAAGKTFETYSENLPSVGYDGATYTAGGANYARKHNPCANWVGTGANQFSATVNQPFSAFPTNYSTLPTLSIVVPNMTNDMHDGTYPSNITLGDTWMYNNMDSIRKWSLANNTLYIFIYDEDNDNTVNNNIPVIFYGPMVKAGTYLEPLNFYNLLRTIEDMYGLGHAGSAATSSDILDCWNLSSLGVNNVATDNSFRVMPNPATDVINFTCSSPLKAQVTICVTDEAGRSTGKYIMTGSNVQINTSVYAPGIYYYKIVSDNNKAVSEGKFVITHN